jgi:hypothetical protein
VRKISQTGKSSKKFWTGQGLNTDENPKPSLLLCPQMGLSSIQGIFLNDGP